MAKVPGFDRLEADAQSLYDTLNGESDLACVVVGAAYLDALLVALLQRNLITGDTSKRMFEDHAGALSTYSARADLAYCMGLIPKMFFENLKIIGSLRNTLAHNHLHLDFGDPEIQKKVNAIKFMKPAAEIHVDGDGVAQVGLSFFERLQDTRTRFNIAVAVMVNQLMVIVKQSEQKQPMTKNWGWVE